MARAGWQTVACSPAMPRGLDNSCSSIQGGYSSIAKNVMDAYGKAKVWNYSCDGKYMYVTCCDFGSSLDVRGRANMFAHTFCLPCDANGIISDANEFLGIKEENFKSDVKDAEVIPEKLAYDVPMNIQSAMKKASLTEESYRTLIRCVYTQLSDKKSPDSLYIGYSDDIDEMKAILYCIYNAMPFFVRKKLTVETESVQKAKNANLIFSKNAPSHKRYVIPSTGDNSILGKRELNTVVKNGFVDYAVNMVFSEHWDERAMESYFDSLEKGAINYGDVSASDNRVLKIAHLQIVEGNSNLSQMDDDDLQSRLSDALFAARNNASPAMTAYISALMKEIMGRNIILTDGMEEALSELAGGSEQGGINKVFEEYSIYRFTNLEVAEAARKLQQMPDSARDVMIRNLISYPNGVKIVQSYYLNYAVSETSSWEDFAKVFRRLIVIKNMAEVCTKIWGKAWSKYQHEVVGNPVASFQSFMELVNEFSPRQINSARLNAQDFYWKKMNLDSFSFDLEQEYAVFARTDNALSCFISELFSVVKSYDGRKKSSFCKNLNALFCKNKVISNPQQVSVWLSKIIRYIGVNGNTEAVFVSWIELALSISQDVFEKLYTLSHMIKQDSSGEFLSLLAQILSSVDQLESGQRVRALIFIVLMDMCRLYDVDETQFVGLDIWLGVAGITHSNPFSLLDELESAQIFESDPERTALESEILKKEEGIKQLSEFVSQKGSRSKLAKEWLSAVTKRAKAQEKEKNKSSGKGFLGFIGGKTNKADHNRDNNRDAEEDSYPTDRYADMGRTSGRNRYMEEDSYPTDRYADTGRNSGRNRYAEEDSYPTDRYAGTGRTSGRNGSFREDYFSDDDYSQPSRQPDRSSYLRDTHRQTTGNREGNFTRPEDDKESDSKRFGGIKSFLGKKKKDD